MMTRKTPYRNEKPVTKQSRHKTDKSNQASLHASSWQLSYMDTITLLLAFFVILSGMAHVRLYREDDAAKGLRSPVEGTVHVNTLIAELHHDLEQMLQVQHATGQLEIIQGNNELRLKFRGSSFYRQGDARLLPSGMQIINHIMHVIDQLAYYQFYIDVEGHADNTPINTSIFPSNWELSVARASNIVRYFVQSGFDPKRLKASGYGDSMPFVPNNDEQGNAIPENQDKNRRVVIRLYF